MQYGIEFYEDEHGRMPALEWIRGLGPRKRRVLGTAMREILQQQGIGVCGTPFGKQLRCGLFEFRLREDALLLRVFCHAYGDRIVLLLGGYDKGEDPVRETAGAGDRRGAQAAGGLAPPPAALTNMCENTYPPVMSRAGPDFEHLLEDIEREAAEEGPAGIRDLRALQLKYRLINQLIERRRALHWTQKDLAAQSGIGQAEISKIERGRKSPTLDTYSRLATALQLPAEAIVPPAPAAS